MLFDFGRFTTSVKLAYRRCNGSSYSLDDVLRVFLYYFETYELVMNKAHPTLTIEQIANIIDKMPFVLDEEHEKRGMIDISSDEYRAMIDQHFITKYRNCDYNINHFFSGRIRDMRYYETCY